MNPNQRRECLLNDPGEPRLRALTPRLGQRRHVMDDVAERGSLDEQDVGHLGRAYRFCATGGGLSAGANACIHACKQLFTTAHAATQRT
jgi:hypothetical protein